MIARKRIRAAVVTTVSATALAFVASLAAPAPAMADDLCYGAGIGGTITGTHELEECIQTTLPAACVLPIAGLSPYITAWAEACAPD